MRSLFVTNCTLSRKILDFNKKYAMSPSMTFNDFAITAVKKSGYRINLQLMTKHDAMDRMKKADVNLKIEQSSNITTQQSQILRQRPRNF